MDLHGKIMNIQADSKKLGRAIEDAMAFGKDLEGMLALVYKTGHRDVRHEAAEMVLKTDTHMTEFVDIMQKSGYHIDTSLERAALRGLALEIEKEQ